MWVKVAKISEIEEGSGKVVEADSRQIALFRSNGKFYAIDNLCHHRGGPLGEGYLEGTTVTCPWHAWTYDVTTGECQSVPDANQKCFKVKTEGDDISVEV